MGKKREERGKEKATTDRERDLDEGYVSPIRSWRDLSPDAIKDTLIHSRYLQLLLCLTVLGAFLRFYHLGNNSLWLDEVTTFHVSKASVLEIWQTSVTGEFHPPLFHWITHVMLTLGQSEFILRLAPALFGTLAIPVLYGIGKELRDRNVGIISAALLTVSYFGIYYSQEARAYSMVLLFFSLAILFYLRATRTTALADWALFGIFSAIAVWTHYYTLIALAVLYLHAIISARTRLNEGAGAVKNQLISLGIMTGISLPLLVLVVLRYLKLTAAPPTYGFLGPILIRETIVSFAGGFSLFRDGIAILYVLLLIAGLLFLFMNDRNKFLLWGMLLVLPLAISIALSSKMTMNPRYLIYLLPVFFSGIAMAYPLLSTLIPGRKTFYAFGIVVLLINAPLLGGYYASDIKEDWRGFAGELQQLTREGDIVVVVPGYMSQPLNYYYSNTSDQTLEVFASTGADLNAIDAQRNNRTLFFVVTDDIMAANPGGDAIAWLEENARLLDVTRGVNTVIYLMTSG